MATIILHGEITADGHLHVELPADMPVGPVEIEIRTQTQEGLPIGTLLTSGLIGAWADRTDIEDSVEYARELRKRASRREET